MRHRAGCATSGPVPPFKPAGALYLCSAGGDILARRQADGEPVFLYATGQPMTFQPALAEGNVYAGTANGPLDCLCTGGDDAGSWSCLGGNARHNKTA